MNGKTFNEKVRYVIAINGGLLTLKTLKKCFFMKYGWTPFFGFRLMLSELKYENIITLNSTVSLR